jgi:hypothetical protein
MQDATRPRGIGPASRPSLARGDGTPADLDLWVWWIRRGRETPAPRTWASWWRGLPGEGRRDGTHSGSGGPRPLRVRCARGPGAGSAARSRPICVPRRPPPAGRSGRAGPVVASLGPLTCGNAPWARLPAVRERPGVPGTPRAGCPIRLGALEPFGDRWPDRRVDGSSDWSPRRRSSRFGATFQAGGAPGAWPCRCRGGRGALGRGRASVREHTAGAGAAVTWTGGARSKLEDPRKVKVRGVRPARRFDGGPEDPCPETSRLAPRQRVRVRTSGGAAHRGSPSRRNRRSGARRQGTSSEWSLGARGDRAPVWRLRTDLAGRPTTP